MIVLIGRQNVGKSTLFNRLIGSHQAVVSSIAGTTIDRRVSKYSWQGKEIEICDLAGLPISKDNPLADAITNQVVIALKKAKIILVIVDAGVGLTGEDLNLIEWVRKNNQSYLLVVNKIDEFKNFNQNDFINHYRQASDAKNSFYISALHGKGISELLDYLSDFGKKIRLIKYPKIIIVGRQNVGKSTLFNQLLKSQRSIVSELAGTTRDPVEQNTNLQNNKITLVDSAGIRKKSKEINSIEKQSIGAAINIIKLSDIILMVIDGGEGPSHQDIKIINQVKINRKKIAIIINKWDKFSNHQPDKVLAKKEAQLIIYRRFPFLRGIDVIPISAKFNWNINNLLNWIEKSVDSLGF